MKTIMIATLAALLVCGSAYGTVKTTWEVRDVRNPRTLAEELGSSFTAVQQIIAAIDPSAGLLQYVTATGGTGAGAGYRITVNNGAAAGNKHQLIVAGDGAALLYQTDTAEKDSQVTQLTIAKDGKVTMKGGAILDNTTNADILNITETTVKVTGAFETTGTAKSTGNFTVGDDKVVVTAASGNTVIEGTLGAGGGDGSGLTVDANKDVGVGRDLAVTRNADITGNAEVGGTLEVTGASTLAAVTAAAITGSGNLTVGAGTEFVVTAASGNVLSEGNLVADGILQSGKSGTAGHVDIYPATASRGKIRISAADVAGDSTTTITRGAQAASRTYSIPDAGADTTFVMAAGNSTIAGNKTFSGDLSVGADDEFKVIASSGNTSVKGTLSAAGDFKINTDKFVVTGADGNVAVDGTMSVGGVATLTSAPKFVVTETAQEQTLTMTNAPAAATAGKDTPIYIKITVGETDYVIPAWPLSE